MLTLDRVTTTQDLAAKLIHILGEETDYRRRVDAMATALLGRNDLTAKTALLIALASVAPQPPRNSLAG